MAAVLCVAPANTSVIIFSAILVVQGSLTEHVDRFVQWREFQRREIAVSRPLSTVADSLQAHVYQVHHSQVLLAVRPWFLAHVIFLPCLVLS